MTRLRLRIPPRWGFSRHPRLWVAAVVVIVVLATGWVALSGLRGRSEAPGVHRPPTVPCTTEADVGSTLPVDGGRVVCLSGTSDERLTITRGGTIDAPVIYSGAAPPRSEVSTSRRATSSFRDSPRPMPRRWG